MVGNYPVILAFVDSDGDNERLVVAIRFHWGIALTKTLSIIITDDLIEPQRLASWLSFGRIFMLLPIFSINLKEGYYEVRGMWS